MKDRPVVLIVDDEEEHCRLTGYLLRKEYTIETALNGRAALEIAATKRIDLALVDQRMPGLTGIQVLAKLKDLQPDCIRFLVTAYTDPDVLADAINVGGVYRFLAKPLDPDLLRVDLRRALEHRDSQRSLARAEKLSLLGTLAGSVIHDLRNYAQVLRLLPDLLSQTRDPELIQKVADDLRQVDSGIAHLVAELFALMRGEVPRYELHPGSLASVVKTVVNLEQPGNMFKSRHLDVELSADLPNVMLCEPRCCRLLTNLLRNAAQATSEGGHIIVKVQQEEKHVQLTVQDDGPGIPPTIRERIFDPLFTTKEDKGAGLGLSICRLIMHGHHGTLDLANSTGGATFVARFPLE